MTYGLSAEIGDKVDVLLVIPDATSTKLMGYPKVGGFMASCYECAIGSLRELGRGNETYGAWRHALKASLYDFWYSDDDKRRMITGNVRLFTDMRDNPGKYKTDLDFSHNP